MSGKVYITYEQANEIEAARGLGRKDSEIERDVLTRYVPDSALRDLSISELRTAIYIGYIVQERKGYRGICETDTE